jgi:hypothetical protein
MKTSGRTEHPAFLLTVAGLPLVEPDGEWVRAWQQDENMAEG